MISRHYWPHFSIDAVCRDVRLADALIRAGVHVEVLTPRYAASWPDQMRYREILVHRPVAAPRGSWSIGRYLKQLEAWIGENANRFDVLFSTSCGDEVIPVFRAKVPPSVRRVVLHSGTGAAADHLNWGTSRNGGRVRACLERADAIVVSWPSIHRQLLSMGLSHKRLHRIDLGIPAGPSPGGRSDVAKSGDELQQSRIALARANGDLTLHHDSHVVLACGQMIPTGGMMTLARTIGSLLDIWPDLRLWLIGDGRERESLHAFFRHQGVRQNVAMPGTFVDFEDLLRVAELFVVPSPADAMEDALPAAVAGAVPLIVADSPDARAFFQGVEDLVVWFNAENADQLKAAIRESLVNLPARRAAARSLRLERLRSRPYQSTIAAYKQLFDSLVTPSQRLNLPPIDKIAPS